jgi:general secretion pathway protein K
LKPQKCYEGFMKNRFPRHISSGLQPDSGAGEEGFVLVSVIWIAGLLAVVATAFAIAVRSHTLGGSNVVYNTKAEYIADGVTLLSAFRLANLDTRNPPINTYGEISICKWYDGAAVTTSVQDQGGLVDINTASAELLGLLLKGLGANAAKSAEVTASLQDFRDPDSKAANGGSELVTYPGKSYGPKNGPFAISQELDQMPEIDDELFHKLMPLVTVYSQQSGIDLATAPPGLFQVLGGKSETTVYLESLASPSPAKIFSLDVTAQLKNGALYRRFAIVAVLQQPDRPFAILEWAQGGEAGDVSLLSSNGPQCIN